MVKIIIIILTILTSFSGYTTESFSQMAHRMASKFKAPIINYEKLEDLLSAKKIVIFDTRNKKEFDTSHIKGAVYVGYDNFDIDKALKLIPKNTIVVTYCSVGYRSGDIATRLRTKKIDAYNLFGGIFLWNNSGKKLYSNQETLTNKIHGYSKDWGKWITVGDIVYK